MIAYLRYIFILKFGGGPTVARSRVTRASKSPVTLSLLTQKMKQNTPKTVTRTKAVRFWSPKHGSQKLTGKVRKDKGQITSGCFKSPRVITKQTSESTRRKENNSKHKKREDSCDNNAISKSICNKKKKFAKQGSDKSSPCKTSSTCNVKQENSVDENDKGKGTRNASKKYSKCIKLTSKKSCQHNKVKSKLFFRQKKNKLIVEGAKETNSRTKNNICVNCEKEEHDRNTTSARHMNGSSANADKEPQRKSSRSSRTPKRFINSGIIGPVKKSVKKEMIEATKLRNVRQAIDRPVKNVQMFVV